MPDAPTARRGAPTLKHRLEYALVRILGFVLRRLSPDAASALAGAVLGRIMPLTGRNARVLEHLALAFPDWPEAERRRTARRMWQHFGRVFGEAFLIDRILAEPWRVELPADFHRYHAIGAEGAISAALHLGNWEIAGLLPAKAGLPLAGVYQALHNPLVEDYLKRLRAPAFPAGLFAKGPELGTTLVGLARRGVGIGIVSDLREKRGIGVTFFGHPAFATPLPALLARAAGRPIIAGAVIRTQGVRFRAVLADLTVADTGDRDRDVAEATQALHDIFEGWIRQAPEQWLWTHRKWAAAGGRGIAQPGSVRRAKRERTLSA